MDRVGERVSPVSCPMLDAIHDDTINRNFTVSSVITLSYRATMDRETIFFSRRRRSWDSRHKLERAKYVFKYETG